MPSLAAILSAELGWTSVFASHDPHQARCLVEHTVHGQRRVGEWVVLLVKRDRERNANARDHEDDYHAFDPAMLQEQHETERDLEQQLDEVLGISRRSVADSALQDAQAAVRSMTGRKAWSSNMADLYGNIPKYRLHGDGASVADIISKLFTHQATAKSAHLRTLRGICVVDDKTELIVFDFEKCLLMDCFRNVPNAFEEEKAWRYLVPDASLSDVKKRFLVYQLLQFVRVFHTRGFTCGGLTPSTVCVTESLWVRSASVPLQHRSAPDDPMLLEANAPRKFQLPTSVESLVRKSTMQQWCDGEISNFDYLMRLNAAAGRYMIDSAFHPVIPWVVDFSARDGGWRDLGKSKFRLTKGDQQLDRTFEASSIPHHITESLSEITYCVYMARRVPMPVLKQIVRANFNAQEFPSTMARMFSWTPDECIPEFYSDASVFASIHAGEMDNLRWPAWCEDASAFISWHRAMLESDYVSERLHEWIDLNFGVCLSGDAAISHKNVPLPIANAMGRSSGFVQLIQFPHPPRGSKDVQTKGSTTAQSSLFSAAMRTASSGDDAAFLTSSQYAIDRSSGYNMCFSIFSRDAKSSNSMSRSKAAMKKKNATQSKISYPIESREDAAASRGPPTSRQGSSVPKVFHAESSIPHSVVGMNQPAKTDPLTSLAVLTAAAGPMNPGGAHAAPFTFDDARAKPSTGHMANHSRSHSLLAMENPPLLNLQQWSMVDDEALENLPDVDSIDEDASGLDDICLQLLHGGESIPLSPLNSNAENDTTLEGWFSSRKEGKAREVLDPAYRPPTWVAEGFPKMSVFDQERAHDCFGLGCIVAEIFTSHRLFSQETIHEYFNSYFSSRMAQVEDLLTPWNAKLQAKLVSIPEAVKELVLALVHPDPRIRLNEFARWSSVLSKTLTHTSRLCGPSSLLFPPEFAQTYVVFERFHRTRNWQEQMEIIHARLPDLAQLPPLLFRMVLPLVTTFFRASATLDTMRVEQGVLAVVHLLPVIGEHLDTSMTKVTLLSDIQHLYETPGLSPLLKLCLSAPETIKTLHQCVGTTTLLQVFMPILVDWLVSASEAIHQTDAITTEAPPPFQTECASMIGFGLAELASADVCGAALTARYLLPMLLPKFGKRRARWAKLVDTRPLHRETRSSSAAGSRASLGGKRGDGVHVAYVSKQSLRDPHVLADALLIVLRELGEVALYRIVLPHLLEVAPPLIELAETISSTRVEGVPNELALEVFLVLRMLRHVIRGLSEATARRSLMRDYLHVFASMVYGIQPPFLHPNAPTTSYAQPGSKSLSIRQMSTARPVKERLGSSPPSNTSTDLRAFSAVGVARTVAAVCQKLGAKGATSLAASLLQAVDGFLVKCAAMYSGLETTDYQFVMATEVVAEFCRPLQALLGNDRFHQHLPSLRSSTVLQFLLQSSKSPNGIDELRQEQSPPIPSTDSSNRQSQLFDRDRADTFPTAEDSAHLEHDADKERAAPIPPELLQYAYRSARLNGVKTAGFLRLPVNLSGRKHQDLNENIFMVQEERKRRRAVMAASRVSASESVWMRPLCSTRFAPRGQDADDHIDNSAASGNAVGKSWNLQGEVRHVFKAHNSALRCISLDMDEDVLLTGSWNGTCRVWRLTSHPCQVQGAVYTNSPLLTVQSAMDGVHGLAAEAACVHVWDLRTSQRRLGVPLGDGRCTSLTLLRVLPFQHHAAYASELNDASLRAHASIVQGDADFAVTTGRRIYSVDMRCGPRVVADWRVDSHDAEWFCTSALVQLDSQCCVAVGTSSGNVYLVDKRVGDVVIKWPALVGKIIKIEQYAPSLLLVVGTDKEANVWDLSTWNVPQLRMVVTGIPEGIRDAQIAVQSFADMSVLYVCISSRILAARLVREAHPLSLDQDPGAPSAFSEPYHARLEPWNVVDATALPAALQAHVQAQALPSERARLHRSKVPALCMGVLPLRQVVLLGGEDGCIRVCV